MELIRFLIFLLIVAGGFIYFEISPIKVIEEIIDVLSTQKGRNSLKDQVKAIKFNKKKNQFIDLFASARKTLTINEKGNQFPRYCMMSIAGMVAGVACGMLMNNPFIVPVLAFGFGTAPFIIIRFMSYGYQKKLNNELEISLSIISGAYQSQEEFVSAVNDSIAHIKKPMLTIFKDFIFEVENVNPNVSIAIENMERKIENDTWREWCETIILCQEDRTMRSALNPIINKFSDIKLVTEELSLQLYEPLKQLITIDVMLASMPLIIYLVNKDWGLLLLTSLPGKIVIALDALVIFITLYAGVKHSKPPEYKR